MTAQIQLPGRSGPTVVESPRWLAGYRPPRARRVLAAPHVAARPDGTIDWQATLDFREHLWAHGFGVADAMDTAQRGAGLSWDLARELIRQVAGLARQRGGAVACGAGTDQLAAGTHPLPDIAGAYEEQLEVVQAAGAQVVLMASRALAASARSSGDYLDIYGQLLKQADQPVILHWLGEAFDPMLAGYWGGADFGAAADTVIELISRADGKVDGIKLSVLDAGHELALRRRLPPGVRMYTGDDFHYADLIQGGPGGHSDALLGAFSAITAPAAAALAALDRGDQAGYAAIMKPTVPLSRLIFEAPTASYKAGIAFLAWLNGLQPDFAMMAGFERQRSPGHLAGVFELAAAAGALREPELSVRRMTRYLAGAGL